MPEDWLETAKDEVGEVSHSRGIVDSAWEVSDIEFIRKPRPEFIK